MHQDAGRCLYKNFRQKNNNRNDTATTVFNSYIPVWSFLFLVIKSTTEGHFETVEDVKQKLLSDLNAIPKIPPEKCFRG